MKRGKYQIRDDKDPITRVGVVLTESTALLLKQGSQLLGITRSRLIAEAVRAYLAERVDSCIQEEDATL